MKFLTPILVICAIAVSLALHEVSATAPTAQVITGKEKQKITIPYATEERFGYYKGGAFEEITVTQGNQKSGSTCQVQTSNNRGNAKPADDALTIDKCTIASDAMTLETTVKNYTVVAAFKKANGGTAPAVKDLEAAAYILPDCKFPEVGQGDVVLNYSFPFTKNGGTANKVGLVFAYMPSSDPTKDAPKLYKDGNVVCEWTNGKEKATTCGDFAEDGSIMVFKKEFEDKTSDDSKFVFEFGNKFALVAVNWKGTEEAPEVKACEALGVYPGDIGTSTTSSGHALAAGFCAMLPLISFNF